MVILLDPSYNPDGQQRFSTWVNSNKGVHTIANVNSRELNEPWPRGRTNHYWFDLNRDWLLLTHPESQGRVKTFHEWKPTVLTDHHEMGSNNTFFFQPGIPSRTNPNTPQMNQDLTGKIGEFHAKALDSIGSLYYTKESFDDFYYGKGSTYPDINGAIGILFEQASSRGHKQSTVNGDMDFPFTIRNQVVTSLSTQDASLAIKNDLLSYKRDFYKDAASERSANAIKAYVIKSRDDAKLDAFIDKLSQHQIDVFSLKSNVNAGSSSYSSDGNSYIIPTDQQQSKLIKAMFEKVTSFNDSLFYDVSAWTFPAAFDLQYDALKSGQLRSGMIGDRVSGHIYNKVFIQPDAEEAPYAYLMNWENTMAASAAYNLLREGLSLKVLTKDVMHPEYDQLFEAGTVIIPTTQKNMSTSEVISKISDQVTQYGVKVYPVATGLNTKGPMLGSPSQRPLKTPRIALVVGSGVKAYDAGHIWHHLDHTMSMPVTLLNVEDIGAASLQSYNTLIMADGRYASLSEDQLHHLTHWLKSGGKIMAFKRAIDWLNGKKLVQISRTKSDSKGKTMQLPYSKSSSTWGARRIGGSIFNTQVDLSHPLFYGYEDDQVAFMKRGTTFYDPIANPYATPARYTDDPLVSGYIHKSQIKSLSNSAAVTVFGQGRGKVICFSDNPLFRGYWWGGFRVFNNAILFGDILSTGTTGDDAHGHGHE